MLHPNRVKKLSFWTSFFSIVLIGLTVALVILTAVLVRQGFQ